MIFSNAGLELLKSLEGFSATWYPDADTHSIGYGTTEASIWASFEVGRDELTRITERMATDALLMHVGRDVLPALERASPVWLTQPMTDALISFAYNVGGGAAERSTLARTLAAGDPWAAAEQFDRWVYSQGRVHPGLVRRRAAERALFESGIPEQYPRPQTGQVLYACPVTGSNVPMLSTIPCDAFYAARDATPDTTPSASPSALASLKSFWPIALLVLGASALTLDFPTD